MENINLEKDILYTINHPFLVNMEFVFQNEFRIYFLMRFVAGGELFRHLVDGGLDNLLNDRIDPLRSARPAAVTVLLAASSPTVPAVLLALGAAAVVVSPPPPSLIVSLTGVTSPVLLVLPMSRPGPGPLSAFLSSPASAARSLSSLLWLLILRV